MSLVYKGILVSVVGTFLVQQGITDGCSTEFTAKLVEWLPIIVGGVISAVGRYRLGGVNFAGLRD